MVMPQGNFSQRTKMTDKQEAYIKKMIAIASNKSSMPELNTPPNYPNLSIKEASEFIDELQLKVFGKTSSKESKGQEGGKLTLTFNQAIEKLIKGKTISCKTIAGIYNYKMIDRTFIELTFGSNGEGLERKRFEDFTISFNQIINGEWSEGKVYVEETKQSGFRFKKGITKEGN